jgi:hypothetical protein
VRERPGLAVEGATAHRLAASAGAANKGSSAALPLVAAPPPMIHRRRHPSGGAEPGAPTPSAESGSHATRPNRTYELKELGPPPQSAEAEAPQGESQFARLLREPDGSSGKVA